MITETFLLCRRDWQRISGFFEHTAAPVSIEVGDLQVRVVFAEEGVLEPRAAADFSSFLSDEGLEWVRYSDYSAYYIGTHPNSFRTGIPGKIVGIVTSRSPVENCRLCFHVRYADGMEDVLPIEDFGTYVIVFEHRAKEILAAGTYFDWLAAQQQIDL